jgi:malate dehydrogenase
MNPRRSHHSMTTVAIFGAGEIGGAVAHALALRSSASRIILIDAAGQVAAGKALDIQQMGAIARFSTRLEGTTDPTRAIGCDVCVVADRAAQPPVEWQRDLDLESIRRLAHDVGRAPLVLAGAKQESLLHALAHEAGLDRRRLIGSAPEALKAAACAMVALEAGCAVSEVSLSVLGRAPHGIVVPWTEASVNGYAVEKVLTQVAIARVERRTAHSWPPGPHALGAAAAAVVHGMAESARRRFCVAAALDGEFDARRAVGTLPALVGPFGIERLFVPSLNTRERVQVETALAD